MLSSRWVGVALLCGASLGCGKKWPAPDHDAQKSALQCDVRTDDAATERCRMFNAFTQGTPFDAWPQGETMDVWLGRQQCRGTDFVSAKALRIKRGTPTEQIVKINRFEGFTLQPFVVNNDSVTGDFQALQRAVIEGPPFDPATIAAAKKPPGDVFFPLTATDSSIATPTEHWRSHGDKLVAVSVSSVQCAAELWKLP